MSNTAAAAGLLRNLKPCRSTSQRIISISATTVTKNNHTWIFRPAALSTLSSPTHTVTPSNMWKGSTTFQSYGFHHDQSDVRWQQLALGLGFVILAASASTTTLLSTSCDNEVVIDPPAVKAARSGNEEGKSIAEAGVVEEIPQPASEQKQQPQFDADFINRISKRTLQVERWLGELSRDPETLKRYQEFIAKEPVTSSSKHNNVGLVDASMTKPDILTQIAQRLMDVEGWGTLPDLAPLVVEHLEIAGLQKNTKEDLVTFYHILRMDGQVLKQAGPCLPCFRALHECFMMQPPNVEVTANVGSVDEWTSPSMPQVCPLHVDMLTKCLDENQNMVQLVRNQRAFEAMQQGMLLPSMIRNADKVEWTRPPFKLDYTPWRDYVQVRGWNAKEVEKRLQVEQQWRNDTFFNDSTTIKSRGQPYWEQVQYEWNDVPVVTLQIDLPRVDPSTGYRLIKAWACDANMPQPHLEQQQQQPPLPQDGGDEGPEQPQKSPSQETQPPPLILGFCDGNPSDNRRRRDKDSVPLSVSVLAARTEAIQVYALYAEYKTTMRVDKARLYHTKPLSLVSSVLK